MHILQKPEDEKHEVSVSRLEDSDFSKITIKRYAFKWKEFKDQAELYKLTLKDDILGLMALVIHPEEQRIQILLLAVSVENKGKEKVFDRIAGTLIAFACREALRAFDEFPCVSLIPKTDLKEHYKKKYGMFDGGRQLFLEGLPLIKLIKEYIP
ncbi:N-acetyltransferase [Pedobacter hiemivivus]|uniref:N-acetyltransferase n=1 Tax=Pedobacter hiemivivus TaxID=2530454 RepID=A0A4U1GHC3_9SPHI|nr:N-acetyltransferase [Pedobacter hiemivivus]TKC63635.1 N-acetyltransferase [Pedobacter hiemivivus]